MALKYISIFQSEALNFFAQIGIFGLKTNHLATLVQFRAPRWEVCRKKVKESAVGENLLKRGNALVWYATAATIRCFGPIPWHIAQLNPPASQNWSNLRNNIAMSSLKTGWDSNCRSLVPGTNAMLQCQAAMA
jgi:hypothetical protein